MNSDDKELIVNELEDINYSFKIGDHLHNKIENHIRIIKKLADRSCTRQRWITEAIKEKLDRETQNEISSIPKDKYFQIKVPPHINEKIEKKIDEMKSFRRSYSKKQLLVEAISEKLEREEKKAKDLLEMAKFKYISTKNS